jgi:hypothetical protein
MTEESTEAVERDDEQAESSGADSEEGKAEQREERDPPAGETDDDSSDDSSDDDESGDAEASTDDEDEESKKAQEKEEEREEAADKVREMEKEGPPHDLEDWPDDAAKYETFGGPEGEHGYHEGPEEEHLGPSSLRHLEDGGVRIGHEDVDDPDEYKSEPIPGGPTDPDAKQDLTAKKIQEEQGRGGADSDAEDSDDDDSDDSESDSEDDADSDDSKDDES